MINEVDLEDSIVEIPVHLRFENVGDAAGEATVNGDSVEIIIESAAFSDALRKLAYLGQLDGVEISIKRKPVKRGISASKR